MKYYFDVYETFIKTIAVEADDMRQAKRKVEEAYNRKEFAISRNYPDTIRFKSAQTEVEECIKQGFVAEEEIETLSVNDRKENNND